MLRGSGSSCWVLANLKCPIGSARSWTVLKVSDGFWLILSIEEPKIPLLADSQKKKLRTLYLYLFAFEIVSLITRPIKPTIIILYYYILIFPDEFKEPINKISFIHCDVDVYNSCKDIIDYCLPYTSIGSIIVFDDYGFDGCEGVTSFCDEMRSNKEFHFIHNLNGHAIFIKYQ